MNIEAIFSDGTIEYRTPIEPEENESVTLRLRTYKGDKLQAFVVSGDLCQEMVYLTSYEHFDLYETKIQLGTDDFEYIYKIVGDDGPYYFDRVGLCRDMRRHYSFSIHPGFSTPSWAKGAVMYQIYADRFNNGNHDNDVLKNEYYYIQTMSDRVTDWDRPVSNFGVAEFYGGDLEGVKQKLKYLKSLGIEVIYFNPLFVSPSNHKYDTSDYDYIDPHLTVIANDGGECLKDGDRDNTHATKYKKRVTNMDNLEASNKFFAEFVEECHKNGIKVIMDGVFNHCGSFNKWLNREKLYTEAEGHHKGAYEAQESPYNAFFKFGNNDAGAWPDNGTYEGWWGFDTLPKLNYEEETGKLHDYVMRIAAKWVSPPFNVDGWRLDVAADLGHSQEYNHKFWKDFRKTVKKANPNAIVLAEHYGNAKEWLRGDEWDTVMNYDAFMEPVTYFLTGMEKHSDEFHQEAIGDGIRFANTMLHFMANFKTSSLQCAMNELSNHDHSRFLTRTNHVVGRVENLGSKAAEEGVNKAVLKLAVMIQMTWPGAPTVYYGDEAGLCGFTDPDNRRTYPWGHEDYDLIDFHRDMIMLHKLSPAIRNGSFRFLNCGRNYISYARFNKNEQYIVAINCCDKEIEFNVPAWLGGVSLNCEMTQVMTAYEAGYSIMPLKHQICNGNLHVVLGPYSGIVYKKEC